MTRIIPITIGFIITAYVCFTPAWAITIDGKDWLQPADFINVNQQTLRMMFDDNGQWIQGAKDNINGIDIKDCTLASVNDVSTMFNNYPELSIAPDDYIRRPNSPWAPRILSDFTPTISDSTHTSVYGFTQPHLQPVAHMAFIQDQTGPQGDDLAAIIGYHNIGPFAVEDWIGVWLYRNPAPVPEPTTLVLLGLGILGMTCMRRKKP